MATKKKLYYKKIVIDVLSEYPIPDDINLSELDIQMDDGDYVGTIEVKKNQMVTGRKAAKMVMAMGSEPLFFQMNEFGNEVYDDGELESEFTGEELPY